MIHTGVDLVDIRTIKKIIEQNNRQAFFKRVCTLKEIDALDEDKRQEFKMAALWGLKEAFSKALGTGFGKDLSFEDIEISYTSRGQPQVNYRGKRFQEQAKNWSIACSVSHQEYWLVAMVVIQGEINL